LRSLDRRQRHGMLDLAHLDIRALQLTTRDPSAMIGRGPARGVRRNRGNRASKTTIPPYPQRASSHDLCVTATTGSGCAAARDLPPLLAISAPRSVLDSAAATCTQTVPMGAQWAGSRFAPVC